MKAQAALKDRQDIQYLFRSAAGYLSDIECPSCGQSEHVLVERKYLFTRLFECRYCRLRYRHPRESKGYLDRFYDDEYAQNDGITTEMPDEDGWQGMVRSGFGEKNVDHYAKTIQLLFPDTRPDAIRMIDYGCSWGYQTHQFRSHGIDCIGFEPSSARASHGRRTLGLSILTSQAEIPHDNHVFFSSHVIEHLPSPSDFIRFAMERLREGGCFVAESPNGSEAFRRRDPAHFSKLWGRVHPNMMSAEFYLEAFKGLPLFMMTYPFDGLVEAVKTWDRQSVKTLDLSGPNLLLIVRKTPSLLS
jgi:hypothetical protein